MRHDRIVAMLDAGAVLTWSVHNAHEPYDDDSLGFNAVSIQTRKRRHTMRAIRAKERGRDALFHDFNHIYHRTRFSFSAICVM